MMKKPPGLWLLLSAGVLWLCFQDVSCVRATSLIFGKSTTTTTTPPDPKAGDATNSTAAADEAGQTGAVSDAPPTTANGTRLTGIPQVDYQLDPNLPRELNGLNLTDYPFYDRVPEEIDFKCDGLHDGFYASVVHKCQVYHHCLYGTRFDFLCANYTAFDQKTFICHFVSEVDCVNSKNFWHRNDALYTAQSTTTIKPLIVYTPPAPPAILGGGGRLRPQAPTGGGQAALQGGARRRKPARRRRPQYDYYDEYDEEDEEYYDEPRYTATEAPARGDGRRRNKRPRPRPRPVYDDEYEEYEDERYDRRRGSSRRGRPTSRRNKEERRKYEDEYEEYDEDDPRFDRSEERRNKKPKEERRRPADDDRKRTDDRRREEKRPTEDRRHDDDDRMAARPKKGSRRPVDDDYDEGDRRPSKRKEELPTGGGAAVEDKAMVKPVGTSLYDRPRVAPKVRPPVPKKEADKYAYKTTQGPAPTQASAAKPADDEEYYEEYEEETAPKKPARPATKDSQADASITSNSQSARKPQAAKGRPAERERDRDEERDDGRRTRPKPRRPPVPDEYEYEEEEKPRRAQKPKNEERRVGQGSRKRPATIEYDDDEEDVIKPRESTKSMEKSRERERDLEENKRVKEKEVAREVSSTQSSYATRRKFGNKDLFRSKATSTTTTPSTTTTTTTSTTTEAPRPKEEATSKPVRIVKRPFLPSRGGNPYISRGLQPVGLKSEAQKPQESQRQAQITQAHNAHDSDTEGNVEVTRFDEEVLKPLKQQRNKPQQDVIVEDFRPVGRPGFINRGSFKMQNPQNQNAAAAERAKPKPEEKNPLDINENEYDVTLNDALNPTLPNLPLRQFPTGFGSTGTGSNANNEYTFSAFHRPRFVVDATINSASSEYQYRYKQPQLVAVQASAKSAHAPQVLPLAAHPQMRQPESHQDFNAQYSTNYQHFRPSPRITHAQTQPQGQTQAFFERY